MYKNKLFKRDECTLDRTLCLYEALRVKYTCIQSRGLSSFMFWFLNSDPSPCQINITCNLAPVSGEIFFCVSFADKILWLEISSRVYPLGWNFLLLNLSGIFSKTIYFTGLIGYGFISAIWCNRCLVVK